MSSVAELTRQRNLERGQRLVAEQHEPHLLHVLDRRGARSCHGLPRGRAVATTAGRLPARGVVHTAGPIWSADVDRSAVLRSCYTESLRVADGLGARSVAFPAISAGVYGWPLEDAAVQAVAGVRAAAVEHVQEVRFVLFDDRALAAFEAALSG